MNEKNKKAKSVEPFFLVVFILSNFIMIFLIFAILEIIFRAAGIGYSTDVFIKLEYMQDYYIENPYFNKKYNNDKSIDFSSKHLLKEASRCMFLVKKPDNYLRGFVLGESSVQGFPFQSLFSFPNMTEIVLKNSVNKKHIELINMGFTGVSSFYIADAAKKLLKYDPDFIVIYAGHNEYYGTYSQTTGGNYFTKNLSLFLKEFRVYQWISSLIPSENISNKTLMSKRFNNLKILPDPSIDKSVAGQFVANIGRIVKIYSKRKIPVFIIEPVCNLIDMPPFEGKGDEELKDLILQYYNSIKEKRTNETALLSAQIETNKLANENANILYLNAVKNKQEKNSNYINDFITAKDKDIVPFRVKSELINELRDFYQANNKKYPNMRYIPLFDKLTNSFGEKILGSDIFIDHLHFNHRGHSIVSRFLAESIAECFSLKDSLNDILRITDNQALFDKLNYYLPAYEIQAYINIAYLFRDTPYKEMLIQYNMETSLLKNNELMHDKDFRKEFDPSRQILAASPPEFVDFMTDFYVRKNDTNNTYKYLISFNMMYPAAPGGNINLGIFLASRTTNSRRAIEYFTKGYYLSDKSPDVLDVFSMYFPKEARSLK